MPRYKYCPDCGKLMNAAEHYKMFCPACRKQYTRQKIQKRKTSQRALATDAFKGTKRWKLFRQRILHRDQFSCQTHYRCGVIVSHKSNPVDHIVPRDIDPDRSYDESNCQTLCKPCHDRKTYWEQRGRIITWKYKPGRWVVFGGSQRSLAIFAERESVEITERLRDDPETFCLVVENAREAFARAAELEARPFELLR